MRVTESDRQKCIKFITEQIELCEKYQRQFVAALKYARDEQREVIELLDTVDWSHIPEQAIAETNDDVQACRQRTVDCGQAVAWNENQISDYKRRLAALETMTLEQLSANAQRLIDFKEPFHAAG